MKTPHLVLSCLWKCLSTVLTALSTILRSADCSAGSQVGSSRFCSCVMSSWQTLTSSACSNAGIVLQPGPLHLCMQVGLEMDILSSLLSHVAAISSQAGLWSVCVHSLKDVLCSGACHQDCGCHQHEASHCKHHAVRLQLLHT